MTKKIILLLTGIALLASCSSKFSLQKRKYNKGYYLAISKHKQHSQSNEKAVKNNKPKVQTTANETPDVIVVNSAHSEQSYNENNTPVLATGKIEVNSSVKKSSTKTEPVILASAKKATAPITKKEFKNLVFDLKKASRSAKGDSDTNTILLVILCLFPFIALIAMYLKDGKKITLNFWVNLLLHLTVVLWLIFGILVVLDVINLA